MSIPRVGYKLVDIPDSLAHKEIVPNLKTTWLGLSYHYLEKIVRQTITRSSWLQRGRPTERLLLPRQQTRGRGRLRREWLSVPNRGIYVSILLRNPLPVQIAPQSTYSERWRW